MRILTTASLRSRFDVPRRARSMAVLLAVAALYALAGTGPATAQGTYYADLNAAVPGLASELVKDDRLAGRKVLVNAHDFFEEGEDGRNLPLSATLRERFRRELSNRGVQVFTLPEGSEDELVILHGRWRELSEPGDRPGPRTIELTVYLVERTAAGQQLLPAAGGRVDAVEEALLTPDLASWGRHVVKELERRAGGRGRRVVHVGGLYFDGVAEPERLQRYLVRRWLRPAFSQSRLFRLASAAGEGSGGALHMDVFVHEKDVEVVLDIQEQGVQVATADFTMARELIPARYLGGETKLAPDAELVADVEQQLRECAGHAHGERWREAWGCYGEVLERDAGNRDAERGREEIERGSGERMRAALGRGEFAEAREVVGEFVALAADSARLRASVGEWNAEIEGAERRVEERRAVAEAEARGQSTEKEAKRRRAAVEDTYWEKCEKNDSPVYCDDYLAEFDDGVYARMARRRLAEIKEAAQRAEVKRQAEEDTRRRIEAESKLKREAADPSNLFAAVWAGDVARVEALLGAGANANASSKDRKHRNARPLHWAASSGNAGVVDALLEGRANPDATTDNGWTPLHSAAWKNQANAIEALLAGGADPNAVDNKGKTALFLAANEGHVEAIKALLAGGADLNAKDDEGRSALHRASIAGHDRAIETLLMGGADSDGKSRPPKGPSKPRDLDRLLDAATDAFGGHFDYLFLPNTARPIAVSSDLASMMAQAETQPVRLMVTGQSGEATFQMVLSALSHVRDRQLPYLELLYLGELSHGIRLAEEMAAVGAQFRFASYPD